MTVEFSYRPDNLRLKRTKGTIVNYLIWDGGQIVAELNGTGVLTDCYAYGLERIKSKGIRYFIQNGQGDVVHYADKNGKIMTSYSYDEYGNVTGGNATNPFRYRGEYYDTDLRLYYLRARWYDSALGEFISEDPVKDGVNWYVYCANNPVKFRDPSGLYLVNIKDYAGAHGAKTSEYTTENGSKYIDVTYNGKTASYYYGENQKMHDTTLNNAFGWSSFLTYDERISGVGIGIRDNKLYKDIITPGKSYYDLDYNGNTIRLAMTEISIHVNMETGDARKLSLGQSTRVELAGWLKGIYEQQFQKEFYALTDAMGEELWGHAEAYRSFGFIPYVNKHARIADLHTIDEELVTEVAIWNGLANYKNVRRYSNPLPVLR